MQKRGIKGKKEEQVTLGAIERLFDRKFDEKIAGLAESVMGGLDSLYEKLDTKIDSVERRLSARIDHLADTKVSYDVFEHRIAPLEKRNQS